MESFFLFSSQIQTMLCHAQTKKQLFANAYRVIKIIAPDPCI